MEHFALIVIVGYWLGAAVASGVYRERAGIGFWTGRLRVFGPRGFGLGWCLLLAVKSVAWPIVLGVWLASGRPEPRVVFNDKAEARRRAAATQFA